MKQKIKLSDEVQELRSENGRLQAALMRAEKDASRRAEHIRSFKTERLTLETENAELRGYIARVLEDDLVREAKDIDPPEVVTHGERMRAEETMRKVELAQHGKLNFRMRSGPKTYSEPTYDPGLGDYHSRDRYGREKPTPLAWQDRD